MNLDMTDSIGPEKLVRHMQNQPYTYDKYLICMGLGPSILSFIDENPSYSGPSYPSSPILKMGTPKNEKIGKIVMVYGKISHSTVCRGPEVYSITKLFEV